MSPSGSTIDVEKDKRDFVNEHHENNRDLELALNINDNVGARIQNPLHGKSKETLFSEVDQFCTQYGFADMVSTFKKGALLAQNGSKFEEYAELSEEDKATIRREKTHKWAQPRALIWTVVLASVGAAVQGWDQS